MCGQSDDGTGCDGCAERIADPALMKKMARRLGVDAVLTDAERTRAADRCEACTDVDACREWLSLTEIRGAAKAPDYCRNADLFDARASEAPT
jgi:hypothetical protein